MHPRFPALRNHTDTALNQAPISAVDHVDATRYGGETAEHDEAEAEHVGEAMVTRMDTEKPRKKLRPERGRIKLETAGTQPAVWAVLGLKPGHATSSHREERRRSI